MSPHLELDSPGGVLTLDYPGPSGDAGAISLDDSFVSEGSRSSDQAARFRLAAYESAKRAMDVTLASIGLLVLSPLFAILALAIKLTDFGPVFYAQARVGKGGRTFKFYKFRSMVQGADKLQAQLVEQNHHDDHRTFKMPRDPRITFVGRFLRRFSLDELPQLWNILKGDMSVVGPRPPLPNEVALYTAFDRRRLEIRPGLTCSWQVSGRSNLPFSEQVQLDVDYIESRCLLLDVKLIALTVPAVFSGRGAY